MERERGALQVSVDGRHGVVIEKAEDQLRYKVRFDDNTEEWIDIERTTVETAAEAPALERELGS